MGFNKDVSFFYSYLLLLDNLQRKERCLAIKLGRAGLGREPPGCAGKFCVAPVPSLPSISEVNVAGQQVCPWNWVSLPLAACRDGAGDPSTANIYSH